MQGLHQAIQFSDLCLGLREFIKGKASLSTIKDFFAVFWNGVEDKQDINDEIVAKTEILEIAIKSFEDGYFVMDDLKQILEENEC